MPVKVLVCCANPIVGDVVASALAGAGHEVAASPDPQVLAAGAATAEALVVDGGTGRRAVSLLRDRGFAGRSLATGVTSPVDLADLSARCGTEGWFGLDPIDEVAARFAAVLVTRRRVLIVDDDLVLARLLRRELEGKGFEVLQAPDAEAATGFLTRPETRPELILLDVNLPGVDGPQLCRFVKGNDRFRGIKVLLCTGVAMETVERLALDCGADGFLLKNEVLARGITLAAGPGPQGEPVDQ